MKSGLDQPACTGRPGTAHGAAKEGHPSVSPNSVKPTQGGAPHPPEAAEAPGSDPKGAGPSPRVLVVDDEPSVRLTVAQMLRMCGYEVVEATSGIAALALVRDSVFDLVVSDIRMPGMDGYDTFRALRTLRPGLHGVAMTGFADDGSEGTAFDAGFGRLIRKPFTFKTLIEAVEAALQAHPSTAR